MSWSCQCSLVWVRCARQGGRGRCSRAWVCKPRGGMRHVPLALGPVASLTRPLPAPCLQDFCSVLQEEAASIGAALRVAAPGLEGFQLPEAFSPQHAAVQHVQLMAQLLGQ